jgi:hypothetical protein
MIPDNIAGIRAEFFDYATSTTTDRARAERAVAVIVAPKLAQYQVHWVESPGEGAALWNSLQGSLQRSLWDSLQHSLWVALQYSIRGVHQDLLRGWVWNVLLDSLWDSLRVAPQDALRVAFQDSLWDSPWRSGWVAYHCAAIAVAGSTGPYVAQMRAYRELCASAYALWVLPGHVILCNKPTSVEVVDGRLLDADWGVTCST